MDESVNNGKSYIQDDIQGKPFAWFTVTLLMAGGSSFAGLDERDRALLQGSSTLSMQLARTLFPDRVRRYLAGA